MIPTPPHPHHRRNRFVSLIYRTLPILFASLLLIPAEPVGAAETAETILIRQALEKDRSGRRRGDAELVVSSYDEDRFIVYDAAGSIDGRGWSVLHESLEAAEAALETDLEQRRYDIKRSVVFIKVWKDKAFVTTVDSGAVIDAASGVRTPYKQNLLWTFRKLDDEWLATGIIVALGDSTAGHAMGRVEATDVSEALQEHATEWSNGSRSGITGDLTEEVVIVDAYFSSNPAKWLIIFSNREEIDEWLDSRLETVQYSLERSVLHAVARGEEAVAVTRDEVTATYSSGEARIVEQRVNTWLLTRSDGSWQVDWAWWKSKPFDSDATALR